MRLIDADAFLKRNEVYADCEFIHPMYQNTLREIVDDEPAIPTQRWVRCEEELPDNTRDVLAVRRYGENMDKQEVLVAHLSVIMSMEHGVDKWWNKTNITHWMDFPEPPKEDA